jgi:sugar phosphate isomerase/epimerase
MLFASPLYILREECAQDLPFVLKYIRALGFDGVELLGFYCRQAGDIKAMLDDLGLKAFGNHVPWKDLKANPDEIIRAHRLIGCRYMTVAGIAVPDNAYPVNELTAISKQCSGNDIRLLYHNHAEELRRTVAGRTVLEDLMDSIPAEVLALEPDLGWMQIGGADPVYYLEKYHNRCPVVHLKDFYLADGATFRMPPQTPNGLARGGAGEGFFEFRPCGYGISNTPKLLPYVLRCQPEWLVMDHDCAYERNPYDDLALSLEYVKALLAL